MEIAKGKIGNALTSTAKDHVVAVTNDLYDEELNKYQSELNKTITDISNTIGENELIISSALNDLNLRISGNTTTLETLQNTVITTEVYDSDKTYINSNFEIINNTINILSGTNENLTERVSELENGIGVKHCFLSKSEYEELIRKGEVDDNTYYAIYED